MKHKVTLASFSHRGKRSNNEDSFFAKKMGDVTVCAVADGMGGAVAGEKASKTAIDVLTRVVAENLNNLRKSHLEEVYGEIQKQINEQIRVSPQLNGMGTTLTCLVFKNGHFFWGNLGDSRIYRIRGGKINQITTDHSYIEAYKQSHGGTVDEAIIKKYGNYLTRSLDGGTDQPDIFPKNSEEKVAHPGDIFLLCSDGLILEKANEERVFSHIILSHKNLDVVCANLVSHALRRGSTDNVTVVLLEYGKHKRSLKNGIHHSFNGFKKKSKNAVLSVLAALVLIFGGFFLLKKLDIKTHQSVNQNPHQPDFSSGEKNGTSIVDHEWEPLSDITDNMENYFTPYPGKDQLDHYVIEVLSGNKKTLKETLSKERESFHLREIDGLNLREGRTYEFSLSVILSDGTKKKGNSITYKHE